MRGSTVRYVQLLSSTKLFFVRGSTVRHVQLPAQEVHTLVNATCKEVIQGVNTGV